MRPRLFIVMAGLALAAVCLPPRRAFAGPTTYTLTPTGDVTLRQNQASLVQTGSLAIDPTKRQALIQFDLSGVTPGHYILSAKLRLHVTVPDATQTVRAHRATAAWTEGTATWNNMSSNYDGAVIASSAPTSAGVFLELDVLAQVRSWRSGVTNNGFMLTALGGLTTEYESREAANSAVRPQLVVVATGDPSYVISKASQVVSDPANGTSNPKRMPGAILEYAVTVSSTNPNVSDADSVGLAEALPAQTSLYVGDLGGGGKGPVLFIDGSTNSRLTYSYINLSSTTDDLGFSNDGGFSYTYVPVADADGFDSTVTHLRIAPKGVFDGSEGNGDPSFTYHFRVRNK